MQHRSHAHHTSGHAPPQIVTPDYRTGRRQRPTPTPLPDGLTQPSLLLAASRAEERFQAFLRANPDIYQEFKRRALALHQRGYRHFGAKAIAEAIRYDAAVRGLPGEGETYRWNNNYTSRMVRLLISEHPELASFFELRELRSA
jgi:hypothetical protein